MFVNYASLLNKLKIMVNFVIMVKYSLAVNQKKRYEYENHDIL